MSETGVPFLPEHQASSNQSDGSSPLYNPTPDEKKVIQYVEKYYSKAKKYRKQYEQKWADYYKMYRGRQWKEIRPAYRHSEVVNVIFQTINSQVPILTDSRPKIEYVPTVPSMYELADILTKVAENDWVHNNWSNVITEMMYDSHFYGTGFVNVGYDPKANMGIGNATLKTWDPFYCFPDPNARDINEPKCRYFIYAEPVDIEEIKKEYSDKAKYFTADVIDLAQGNKTDLENVMFKSPVESRLIVEGTSMYETAGRDQVLKLTLYSKDGEIEENETIEEDLDGNQKKEYVQTLKYPRGRRIVIASGILCEDGPFEFDDTLIPAAKINNYMLPREFWGISEIEQLEMPQKALNRLISFANDNLTLMGNPIWLVGSEANIDTDNLFNKPGLVVESDNIDAIRREGGVELPGYVMQMVNWYRQALDGLSGESDLSRGTEPTNDLSGEAIGTLQEAQQTRLRLKARLLDALLQQAGKLYMNRVLEFYSLPRIIRVTGDDGAVSFFHFHVEKEPNVDPKTGQPDGTFKKFAVTQDHDDNGMPGAPKRIEIMGDFDVRVSTGSALPFAKEEKQNLSMQLFKMQVIDDEELLKNVDYPNWEAVLNRMNQKKAQAAQAQQQSQQAQQQQQMQMIQEKAQIEGQAKVQVAQATAQAKAHLAAPPAIPGQPGPV